MPSVTINFSASHAARIQAALNESFDILDVDGNERPATVADLKDYIRGDVIQLVRTSEQRVEYALADSNSSVVDIT